MLMGVSARHIIAGSNWFECLLAWSLVGVVYEAPVGTGLHMNISGFTTIAARLLKSSSGCEQDSHDTCRRITVGHMQGNVGDAWTGRWLLPLADASLLYRPARAVACSFDGYVAGHLLAI